MKLVWYPGHELLTWAAEALVELGRKSDALRTAESCRHGKGPEPAIDQFCEPLLLSSGMEDEAYRRYGLTAMHWMVRGIGFEINEADVVAAYSRTLKAAERLDRVPEVIGRIRGMLEEAGSTKKRVLRVSVNRVAWWGPLW